jgi:hypothetical protein
MEKRYDPTTRDLVELGPPDWLRFLRVSLTDAGRVRVIDSNLSTVTADADKVLWVDEIEPWIEHVEFQAGRDIDLADRVHFYSTLLGRRHKVPVHSTVVLLRPAADGPDLNGTYERRHRNGDVYDFFRYDVLRAWELPLATTLAAGLAVLPLAPVTAVEPEQVPGVLAAISARFVREASPDQAVILWAATKVLLGLRYSEDQVKAFTSGVTDMLFGIRGLEESSVYQGVLARGRIKNAQEAILLLGRKKFGEPDDREQTSIDAIKDVDQLNSLLERVLDVSSWDELFQKQD